MDGLLSTMLAGELNVVVVVFLSCQLSVDSPAEGVILYVDTQYERYCSQLWALYVVVDAELCVHTVRADLQAELHEYAACV